jgi:hypothetical protein
MSDKIQLIGHQRVDVFGFPRGPFVVPVRRDPVWVGCLYGAAGGTAVWAAIIVAWALWFA